MKAYYKTLTAIEFNRVIKQLDTDNTRIKEDTINMARKVLVDNESASIVAKENNITRQSLSRSINAIYRVFEDLQGVPSDWVTIRVTLPVKEAQKTLEKEKTLREEILGNSN